MARQLDKRDTGNYVVEFWEESPEEFFLKVLYVGEWAGGLPVTVWLDVDNEEDAADEWDDVHGDFDVWSHLSREGYDRFTNPER